MTSKIDHHILKELEEIRSYDKLIRLAMIYCKQPVYSSAFHPAQKVTQGQVKTAQNLLDYLIEYANS